jgi:hypothetical protein
MVEIVAWEIKGLNSQGLQVYGAGEIGKGKGPSEKGSCSLRPVNCRAEAYATEVNIPKER